MSCDDDNTLLDFLADRLADSETGWSLGTFGAIAEFTRDADEALTLAVLPELLRHKRTHAATEPLPPHPALAAWVSAHDKFDPLEAEDSTDDHPCTA